MQNKVQSARYDVLVAMGAANGGAWINSSTDFVEAPGT
jgi:hypothetical protein